MHPLAICQSKCYFILILRCGRDPMNALYRTKFIVCYIKSKFQKKKNSSKNTRFQIHVSQRDETERKERDEKKNSTFQKGVGHSNTHTKSCTHTVSMWNIVCEYVFFLLYHTICMRSFSITYQTTGCLLRKIPIPNFLTLIECIGVQAIGKQKYGRFLE